MRTVVLKGPYGGSNLLLSCSLPVYFVGFLVLHDLIENDQRPSRPLCYRVCLMPYCPAVHTKEKRRRDQFLIHRL